VSDMLDEDAILGSSPGCPHNKSYARVRGIWRTTRHTDRREALHRSRLPADQSGKLDGEVVRQYSREDVSVSGVSVRMYGDPHEETAFVEFKL